MKLHSNYFGAIENSLIVEVPINNTSGKYKLPDEQLLQGKTLTGVGVIFQNSSGNVKTPAGNDVATDQVQDSSYLVLESDSVRQLDQVPLQVLKIADDHRLTPLDHIRGVNPTKSFIEVPSSVVSAASATGDSFLLVFTYLNDPK
jgi:PKD repeat protein